MVQDKDVFVEQSSIRHLEYDVGGIADDKEERRRRWRKKMLVILKEERVARVERGDVKRLLKIQRSSKNISDREIGFLNQIIQCFYLQCKNRAMQLKSSVE